MSDGRHGVLNGPIQGQGLVAFKVRNSSIFKIYLVPPFSMGAGKWLQRTISKCDWAGFLTSVLVFVSRDFELGKKLRCDLWNFFSSDLVWLAGVDRQSCTGLNFCRYSQLEQILKGKKTLWIAAGCFYGPTLSLNQQCQSSTKQNVLSNSLDNISDGNVENTIVQRLNLNGTANKSTTQWDCCSVNEVNTFTTEPSVQLVLHDKHDIRWKYTTTQISCHLARIFIADSAEKLCSHQRFPWRSLKDQWLNIAKDQPNSWLFMAITPFHEIGHHSVKKHSYMKVVIFQEFLLSYSARIRLKLARHQETAGYLLYLTAVITTFSFCLSTLHFQSYSGSGRFLKRERIFGYCRCRFSTGQMSFLLPKQQHQSTTVVDNSIMHVGEN